jgi:hypothetical protein
MFHEDLCEFSAFVFTSVFIVRLDESVFALLFDTADVNQIDLLALRMTMLMRHGGGRCEGQCFAQRGENKSSV